LESPGYDAKTATDPAVVPVIVTEHFPFVRVHVAELRETDPVPLWDQLAVPVGE